LQYEIVRDGKDGKFYLVQVRKFADVKVADWQVPTEGEGVLVDGNALEYFDFGTRVFGVTPTEGIVLPVATGRFCRQIMLQNLNRDAPYILAPENIHNRLEIHDFPLHVRGYIPIERSGAHTKTAMPHNNTKIVQYLLRQHGIAILMGEDNRDLAELLYGASEVRIFSDGRSARIVRES
jgi:hypothetical protein